MRLPNHVLLALQVFVLLGAVAGTYLHSVGAPYVLDDVAAIERNDSTRDLRALATVLQPPADRGVTVGGRPVLNLSLAANRAVLGHWPEAYRVVNVAIHAGCVLLAFGVLRRLGTRFRTQTAGFGDPALHPGFAVALVWAVHPVNTAAVTYLSQRAESLASLFYLLTVYAFLRARTADRLAGAPRYTQATDGLDVAGSASETSVGSTPWRIVSIGACFLGVATKEIVVTAPLVILLLDRWFIAGSWRAAWNARRGMYLALGASWVLAAFLMQGAASRGGTIGFSTPITPGAYLGTQVYAIAHYLQLAAWPTPLVFDHGTLVLPWRTLAGPGLALLGLGTLIVAGWRQRHPLAAAVAIFLLLLAPTSSIVPIASQTVAEHRAYLPLLLVVTAGGFGAAALAGRRMAVAALTLAAVAMGTLTAARNAVFGDEVALWAHTTTHQPGNPRAWSNLGVALARAQQVDAAVRALERATALQPDFAEAQNNLGALLLRLGRPAEALPHLEHALRLRADEPEIHGTHAAALFLVGRIEEAASAYRRALADAPDHPELQFGLANTELQRGRVSEAIGLYERVLRQSPTRTDARYNLGLARLQAGQSAEALAEFETVLRTAPSHAAARLEAANIFHYLGRFDEAAAHYRALLKTDPQSAAARAGLQRIDVQTRRPAP